MYADDVQWQFVSEKDPRYAVLTIYKNATEKQLDLWKIVRDEGIKPMTGYTLRHQTNGPHQLVLMAAKAYGVISTGYDMRIVYGAEITITQGQTVLAHWEFPWQDGDDNGWEI